MLMARLDGKSSRPMGEKRFGQLSGLSGPSSIGRGMSARRLTQTAEGQKADFFRMGATWSSNCLNTRNESESKEPIRCNGDIVTSEETLWQSKL
jgi:hypothetical protein